MSGTEKATPDSLTSTSVSPTATTSHSIGEIYTILANIKVNKATSTYSSLTPTSAPGGTGYTLEDIWNLINNSTYAAEGNHDITKATTPSASMHTTSDIYTYLNDTFKVNLALNKVRSGAYYFGNSNPGTFVIANLGEYCEANDECNTNYCGDDSWYGWQTGTTQCTTGEIGSVCNNANQCSTNICGYGQCSDGAVGRGCDSDSQCTLGHCDTAVTGSCTDGNIGSDCDSNADCSTGLYCGDTQWMYSSPACTDGSAGQYCGGPDSCAPGNYCNYNDYTCTATDGEIGSGCGQNSDCGSGYCDQYNSYTCTNGGVGVGCSAGNQCSSGYCNTDFNECSTGQIGAPCGATGDCISTYCGYDFSQASSFCTNGGIGEGCSYNAACVSGYCDVFNSQCSDGSIGSGCTNNNQCSSNLCSSVVNECISGDIGSSCTVGQECDSTYCDTFNGICKTDGAIGSACGLHSECDSEFCSSNVCTAATLTSRLSAYWNFNETSGTAASDSSGNGKVGVLVSGVLVNQTGKLGTGFRFDGTNDVVTVNNIDIKDSSFTFSVWVANTKAGNSSPFSMGSSGTTNGYLWIRKVTTTNKVGFGFHNYGTYVNSNNSMSTNGTWEHWVFVYKLGVGKKIYKNGVLDITDSNTQAFKYPSGQLRIGHSFDAGQYLGGTMDEIGLWNRALTADEVTQLYNGGAGLGYSSF